MNNRSYMLVLCFGVVLSARFTMAINSFELHKLMNKLDYLKDKLQDVEQSMKDSLKETEHLQEKLTKHENNINEKIETIEARMHTLGDSLKKRVEASEENTRTKLEELKYHIQEKAQTELKKLGENKEILDMLMSSMHNLITDVETRSKTLEDHLIAPLRSCRQVTGESGTYLFRLWEKSKPFEVFCEQNKFDGGWIVIQHRFNDLVDFYRNWTEYRNGFGNVNGEFWLGLEYVHQITKNRPHELLVEIKDFHGNYGYAKYGEFEIGNETELYTLKKLGKYSGTAGDSMDYHKNQKFTTFDRDNDEWDGTNCAKLWQGAWWYVNCHFSNLNGRYKNTTGDGSAMIWHFFKNDKRGLSYSRMMIRNVIN